MLRRENVRKYPDNGNNFVIKIEFLYHFSVKDLGEICKNNCGVVYSDCIQSCGSSDCYLDCGREKHVESFFFNSWLPSGCFFWVFDVKNHVSTMRKSQISIFLSKGPICRPATVATSIEKQFMRRPF